MGEGRRRPLFLIAAVPARIVGKDELRAVDPELSSFHDRNTPESHEETLARAGLAGEGSGPR